MKSSFKCENCLTITKISGEGNSNLTCQSCGCPDIKFSTDVVVAPHNAGDMGEPISVKAGEPFLGRTKGGDIWYVTFPAVSDSTQTPNEAAKQTPPGLLKRK